MEGVAQGALGDEADLFVDAAGPGVEGVYLQRDAVQAELLEAVGEDEPGGLGAEAPVLA